MVLLGGSKYFTGPKIVSGETTVITAGLEFNWTELISFYFMFGKNVMMLSIVSLLGFFFAY